MQSYAIKPNMFLNDEYNVWCFKYEICCEEIICKIIRTTKENRISNCEKKGIEIKISRYVTRIEIFVLAQRMMYKENNRGTSYTKKNTKSKYRMDIKVTKIQYSID